MHSFWRDSFFIVILSLPFFSAVDLSEPLNTIKFNEVIDKMNLFKEFVPADVLSFTNELTSVDKQEIISTVNELRNHLIPYPKTREEVIQLLQTKTAGIFPKLQKLNETYMAKLDALKPTTRNVLLSWAKDILSVSLPPPPKVDSDASPSAPAAFPSEDQLRVLVNLVESYKKEPASMKEDLKTQFPEIVAFLGSSWVELMVSQAKLQLQLAKILKSDQ